MVAHTQTYDLAEKLERTQAEIRQARSAAFVDYRPTVLGVELNPITVGSYNRLIAFESPFVMGGAVDFAAVFGFVWLHHPAFRQGAETQRKRLLRACWRAVNPRFENLNIFIHIASQFPGFRWMARFRRQTAAARLADAVAEIRRLVDEALNDFPKGDEDAPAAPVAMHAQLLNTFRRTLSLTYAETEAMPLKRAVQLLRETMHAAGSKGIGMMHPREAAIWREHMDRQQAKVTAKTNS